MSGILGKSLGGCGPERIRLIACLVLFLALVSGSPFPARAGSFVLSVKNAGTGSGTEVSVPAGINCTSGTCTGSFAQGTSIDITATPNAGSTCNALGCMTGCHDNPSQYVCHVVLNANTTITATYGGSSSNTTLTVKNAGTGSGTEVSVPAGINCTSGTCTGSFAPGASIDITATPNSGSTCNAPGCMTGCHDNPSQYVCHVVLNADTTIIATFGGSSDTQPPSVPTNLSASAASSSQINLSWSASTDNVGVKGYEIFQDGLLIATASGTSYSNTGLAPNTTYSYAVAAYDAAGNVSGLSAIASATTTGAGLTLTVKNAGTGSGTEVSVPAGINCTSGTCTGSFAPGTSIDITATPNAGSTCNAPGCMMGCHDNPSQYVCHVVLNGNTTIITTFGGGSKTTPPTVPTGLIATASQSSLLINLSWNASSPGTGGVVRGYEIFRGGSLIATAPSTSYADNTGLAPSTTYTYNVAAYDLAGNLSGQSASASAKTAAAGTVLTVKNAGAGSGTEVSVPAGINCSAGTCTASFVQGTVIDITATPKSGSTFATGGWTGCNSYPSQYVCQVVLNANTTITATYGSGGGGGTCGSGCNSYYVDPANGSDSNDGTTATTGGGHGPWKTICHADSNLALGMNGTVVNLAAGTYDKNTQLYTGCGTNSPIDSSLLITTSNSGTSTQHIAFTGPSNWWQNGGASAKITGSWTTTGNFVDVRNIEITSPTGPSAFTFGVYNYAVNTKGNNDSLKYAYIHDIGNASNACGFTGGGATAVSWAFRVHDSVVDSVVVNGVDVPYGCSQDAGNGGYAFYMQGPHDTLQNSMASGAQGGGLSVYHNVCNDLIQNNVFVHNGTHGVQIAGEDIDECKANNCTPRDCLQNDFTTFMDNLVVDNGYTCGAANTQNKGIGGGLTVYSTGSSAVHDVFAYNAIFNNWAQTGNRNCSTGSNSQNGTLNNIQFGGGDGNNTNPPGLSTNLSGTGNTGLVTTFGDSVVPVSLGGSSNFVPLSSGPLHNAVPSTANTFCPGSPGFASPCVPTVDLLRNSRGLPTSIGAY